MPSILGVFIAEIAAFLAKFLGRRAAKSAALGLVLLGGWVALQAAVYGLWTGLNFVTPPAMNAVLNIVFFLLPSNTPDVLGTLVAARMLRWHWDAQREFLTNSWGG